MYMCVCVCNYVTVYDKIYENSGVDFSGYAVSLFRSTLV